MDKLLKVVLVAIGIFILGCIADVAITIIVGLLVAALPYILVGLGIALLFFIIYNFIKN